MSPRTGLSVMDDGYTPYTPGVNCMNCGRFVGPDGSLEYEHREMSSELASLSGECARCLREERLLRPLVRMDVILSASPRTLAQIRAALPYKASEDAVRRALRGAEGVESCGYYTYRPASEVTG